MNFGEFYKGIESLSRARVQVGVVQGGRYEDGISNVDLLEIHEFGLGGVDARSPLQSSLEDEGTVRDVKNVMKLGIEGLARGRDVRDILSLLGETLSERVRVFVKEGKVEPPLSFSYVEKKRKMGQSELALIATGALLDSIGHEVKL